MQRWEIINLLIKKNGYKSYLEIGLDDPRRNFLLVNCENKESVDPYPIEQHTNINCDISNGLSDIILENLTYRETSDEFFAHNQKKYDIIFIDGLHTEEQSSRDLMNSMLHLNPGGKIVLHDSCPFWKECQVENAEDVALGDPWLGQVWKTIVKLGMESNEFTYHTLFYQPGVTIVDYSENIPNINYGLALSYEEATRDQDYWRSILHAIDAFDYIGIYL